MQRQWMKDLRERSPRVHCITNYVTAGDVANMVLAAGGSPVMAQGLHEVEDVTSICSSLVLNLGTLEERTIPAMEAAGRKAAGLGLPVILDPVGVTASRFRRQTAIDIIRKTSPSVIRGNEAEIRALNQELRSRRIYVTAVCPGPVKTEFFDIAESTGVIPLYKRLVMANPKRVVQKAIRDSIAGREISVYGITMKAFRLLCKMMPHRLLLAVMSLMND